MLQHLYTARCYSRDSQKMIASAGAGTFCGSSARTFVRYEGHLALLCTTVRALVWSCKSNSWLIQIRSKKICTLYNIIHVVLCATMDLLSYCILIFMILQVSQSRASSIIWLPPCTSWRLRVRHPEFLDHCEAPFGSMRILTINFWGFHSWFSACSCSSLLVLQSFLSVAASMNHTQPILSQTESRMKDMICMDMSGLNKIEEDFLIFSCCMMHCNWSLVQYGEVPCTSHNGGKSFSSTRRRAGKWECIQGTSFQCRKR